MVKQVIVVGEPGGCDCGQLKVGREEAAFSLSAEFAAILSPESNADESEGEVREMPRASS